MKKIISGISILLFMATVGYCQKTQPSAVQKSVQTPPLTLIIKSDKQVYELGEEITIDFQVTNNSGTPIVIGHNYPEQLRDKQDVLVVATTLNVKRAAICILEPAWKRDVNEPYHKVTVNPYKTIEFKGVVINHDGKCFLQGGQFKDDRHPCFEAGPYKLQWFLGKIDGLEKIPSSNTITIEVGEKSKKTQETTSLEMRSLIENIHNDLLSLRGKFSWLSHYDNRCFNPKHLAIFYLARDENYSNVKGPRPAQPDQLLIEYLPLEGQGSSVVDNEVAGVKECEFPSSNAKIFALILIRGESNQICKESITKVIIDKCRELRNNK